MDSLIESSPVLLGNLSNTIRQEKVCSTSTSTKQSVN
jgi:hypothetical protein